MEKIILSLPLCAGVTGVAQAQHTVKYGLKGAFNVASFSSWNDDDNGSQFKPFRPGFSVGSFVNFNLSKRFAIQPELLYAHQRGFLSNFEGSSEPTLKSTRGYVAAPLMLRASFGGRSQFFVELGPQVGFLVYNRDFTQTGGSSSPSSANTSTDDLNKVAVGLAAGLGYQLPHGFSLGLRSVNDFSRTYKNGASQHYPASVGDLNGENPSVRNLLFQLQVE